MSSSIKCPHCGLVQFSTGGTCKRCKKDVGVAADFSSHTPPRGDTGGVRGRTDPLKSWVITLILVITNSALGYVVAQRSDTTTVGLVVGRTIGGLLAWPLVLLIIYGLSRKFRERYSIHEVINYGLGLNTIIQAMPIFARLVIFLKQAK